VIENLLAGLSSGLVTAGIIAIATTGFSLQFGITNFLNVAYGDYLTLAAFLWYAFAVAIGMGALPGLIIALALTAVFSVICNRYLFRQISRRYKARPLVLMIVSLALSILIENFLLAFAGSGYFSVHFGSIRPIINADGFSMNVDQIIIILISVVAMFLLTWLLKGTRLGKSMRAMADDVVLAQASGINTRRTEDFTWIIVGLIASISGFVLVLNTASFNTSTGNALLWLIIPAAFVGGIGNPFGAMAGGALLGLVSGLASGLIGAQWDVVVAAAILLGVLLWRPQGIIAVVRGNIG
jgi:branched-chain amino acid transport system permease protein/neutral amino acid transport system permease protein